MRNYKICVYAICKNESKFIDRWVDSVGEADKIFVFDTGSTDDSVKKLLDRGVVVKQEFLDPFYFDQARNKALEMVDDDTDICVCLDLDEVFEKGWRNLVEKSWTPETVVGRYKFVSHFFEDGRENRTFLNEKIHIREDFVWEYPIHECLIYKGKSKKVRTMLEGVFLGHYPDTTKSRDFYLGIMEDRVKCEPQDSRTKYKLAKEYFVRREWEKCIKVSKEYLEMPTSTYDNQRGSAMRSMASSYKVLGDIQSAIYWSGIACLETPLLREPFLDSAKLWFYQKKDIAKSEYYIDKALDINFRGQNYFLAEGSSWGYYIYQLGASIKYRLKKYQRAYELILIAKDMNPDDEKIKTSYDLIKDKATKYY